MIYLIQLIALLFSICAAFHDAPAANVFRESGVSEKELKVFHGYGLCFRILFVLLCSLFFKSWIFAILIFVEISLVFDPAINIKRKIHTWDYISENDFFGKNLIRIFGKNAGKIKALICILTSILLNYLIIKK